MAYLIPTLDEAYLLGRAWAYRRLQRLLLAADKARYSGYEDRSRAEVLRRLRLHANASARARGVASTPTLAAWQDGVEAGIVDEDRLAGGEELDERHRQANAIWHAWAAEARRRARGR